MIGPATSYYDPDQALAQQAQETVNYQRWVEAYGSGPPQGQTDFVRGNHHNVAAGIQYSQQRQQAQGLAVRVPNEQPVPMQNQYNFVPDQYAPTAPSTLDHPYSRPPAQLPQTTHQTSARPAGSDYSRTHQPQSGGSLHGAVGYNPVPQQQQTMNNELYYFPQQQELVGTGDHSLSYGYSASGQQQTEQPYSSPIESFTPVSDLRTLPAHNSVSPPWTTERLPQNPYAPGSSKSQVSRSGLTATKKDRSSAKKPVNRKRPRQGGGGKDSESESDEDTFEPVQTPPRGPDNMPTRL